MAELPLHLQRLQTVPSALDIIRFLNAQPQTMADFDTIMTILDISERRAQKATRRLVTTGYMLMREEYAYQLTEQGLRAAEELAEYDAAVPVEAPDNRGLIRRQLLLALPQVLVAGRTHPLQIGLPADPEKRFGTPADVVLRVSGIYAEVDEADNEIMQVGNGVVRQSLTITPEFYTQARIKIEVFQLSQGGDDLHVCGGMYVDVDVVTDNAASGLVAYGTDLQFEPTS